MARWDQLHYKTSLFLSLSPLARHEARMNIRKSLSHNLSCRFYTTTTLFHPYNLLTTILDVPPPVLLLTLLAG